MNVEAHRRFLDRAEAHFAQADFIYRALAEKLVGRIAGLRTRPQRVLELGCRHDAVQHGLKQLDSSIEFVQRPAPVTMASLQQEPPGQFDLVVCNLGLSGPVDWHQFGLVIRLLLKPEGAFFFSVLGKDSFGELKRAFGADPYAHVYPFLDMHPIGDQLLSVGFEHPVLETEHHTIEYRHLKNLFRDLKQMGWQYAGDQRRFGLTPKGVWQSVRERYTPSPAGCFTATLEVILGHAWAGALPFESAAGDEEVCVPVSRIQKPTSST